MFGLSNAARMTACSLMPTGVADGWAGMAALRRFSENWDCACGLSAESFLVTGRSCRRASMMAAGLCLLEDV